MENKGLCSTCVNAKSCILKGSLAVWLCEEFSDCQPKEAKSIK